MEASVDLYWLPLGAGGRSVRLNGRVFEALCARLDGRPPCDLYHSALVVRVPEGEFVVEMAPVRDRDGELRGVVAEGPVGSRRVGSWRSFRYENRCWRGGVIPDVDEAVDSPQRLSGDPARARRLLELVPAAPTPVWGRDELRAGEMWNSNSLVSWLLERSGVGLDAVEAPAGGRAPGWHAGLVVARREATAAGRELPLATGAAGLVPRPGARSLRRAPGSRAGRSFRRSQQKTAARSVSPPIHAPSHARSMGVDRKEAP